MPFEEFNVPIFPGVNKAVDALVEEHRTSKVFGVYWEVVGIFHWELHKVVADDFCLGMSTNEVCTFEDSIKDADDR